MAKVTIKYERLFPLGKFENERIGLEMEFEPVCNDVRSEVEEMYKDLRKQVNHYHNTGQMLDDAEEVNSLEDKEKSLRQEKIKKLKEKVIELEIGEE